MDFFDSQYYSMNRKFLLLLGLWPFQNKNARLTRQLAVVCIVISGICVQIAKLVTSQVTLDMKVAIAATPIGFFISLVKYFSFTIQIKKIEMLLGSIEAVWKGLRNDIDRQITEESAAEGRKYIFIFSVYVYGSLIIINLPYLLQPLLDVIAPQNETREKLFIYPGEYFVDDQKYFYPITLHMTVTILVQETLLLGINTMYHACIYHVRGIFKVISYRLEHAYDKFKQDAKCTGNANSETRARIASAVEYHLTVTQFVEVLISTFHIEQFLSFLLTIANITITLYWAALSIGNISDLIIALLYGAFQMIWAFFLVYPCQKVMDDSSVLTFKAYSGLWYNAPFELQTLVVPIMERGTKPTIICALKIFGMTSEFYGKAIQLSISYFTVLLSVTST